MGVYTTIFREPGFTSLICFAHVENFMAPLNLNPVVVASVLAKAAHSITALCSAYRGDLVTWWITSTSQRYWGYFHTPCKRTVYPPWKPTWRLLENHLIFNRRYIILHACLSIVILVFGGVTKFLHSNPLHLLLLMKDEEKASACTNVDVKIPQGKRFFSRHPVQTLTGCLFTINVMSNTCILNCCCVTSCLYNKKTLSRWVNSADHTSLASHFPLKKSYIWSSWNPRMNHFLMDGNGAHFQRCPM